MIVTDVQWTDLGGILRSGYYMDNFLVENLHPTADFIKMDRDVVGIISGHGTVRNGKSTLGTGVGYFLAWLIAGGRMNLAKNDEGKYLNPVVLKKPTKPVRFGLENFVYTSDQLIERSDVLYKKYGKNQVLIMDEQQGLDSAGTMKKQNQDLARYFQTCGWMNNVVIVILPSFFKLNEDIATTRSMFLIDTYSDKNWNRGYFNYFGPVNKEWLYFKGKKLIGVGNKYGCQRPDFFGRFRDWRPFDKEEYERNKREALKNVSRGTREERVREKYWATLTLLKENTKMFTKDIAKEMSSLLFREITRISIENDIVNYRRWVEKQEKKGYVPK